MPHKHDSGAPAISIFDSLRVKIDPKRPNTFKHLRMFSRYWVDVVKILSILIYHNGGLSSFGFKTMQTEKTFSDDGFLKKDGSACVLIIHGSVMCLHIKKKAEIGAVKIYI